MKRRDAQPSTPANDEHLRAALLAAFPAQNADPGTWERVEANLARQTARPRPTRRPLRLAFGLIGILCLAALAVALGPTLPAASALQRMDAALADVRSAHQVFWHFGPDGKPRRDRELWYQDGRWRIEKGYPQHVQILGKEEYWIYDAAVNRVTRQRQIAFPPNQRFTLSALLRDYARHGWEDRLRIEGKIMAGGRPAWRVVIDHNETVRSVLLVDRKTNLPFRTDMYRKKKDRWEHMMAGTFRFNEPLPAYLFESGSLPAAPFVDIDVERQAWGQHLSRSIARKQVGARSIAIRDVQVNADGDVFLLYTAGRRPTDDVPDYELEIRDELGTAYLTSMNFRPYMPDSVKDWPGYEFEGEMLEGTCWFPVTPQQPWQPRRFTLTFRIPSDNQHGKLPAGTTVEKETLQPVVFTLDIRKPSCTLLPDYMLALPMNGGMSEIDLLRERLSARAYYHRQTTHDLEQAAAYYRELIEVVEQHSGKRGSELHDPTAWADLYQILRTLGRSEEADQLLKRAQAISAREEAIFGDSLWTKMQKLLRLEEPVE